MNWLLLIEASVLGVLLWAGAQLALWLSTRRENERFLTTKARLEEATSTTVKEIQQVVVEDLKAQRVGGRLKSDTVSELRATALKALLANLGPLGLKELRRSLGVSRKAPLDRVLVSYLEAAVYDLKENHQEPTEDKVPPHPGKRFCPDTVRLPRAQVSLPPEEDIAGLYDTTPKRGKP